MVLTPEQRDALAMARSLLAACDRTSGRAYDNGTGEDMAEAVRVGQKAVDILRNVSLGGQGPEIGASALQSGQGQQLGQSSDADRLIAGLLALVQASPGAGHTTGAGAGG